MKKIIVGILLLSSTAFALPFVESVSQNLELIPSCGMCDGGTLQTTTTFVITESSCAEYKSSDFKVNVEKRQVSWNADMEIFVRIALKDNVADCRGPQERRTYSVTTTELDTDGRYFLENPRLLSE